jgi:hypothetical protein
VRPAANKTLGDQVSHAAGRRGGKITAAGLEGELEKNLAADYGVSRDTARKARNAVLSEFPGLNSRQKATNERGHVINPLEATRVPEPQMTSPPPPTSIGGSDLEIAISVTVVTGAL